MIGTAGFTQRVGESASTLAGIADDIEKSVLDESEIRQTLIAIRLVERLSSGIVTALAGQSRRLASCGTGPAAEDELTRNNAVPLNQARTELRRAHVLSKFPAVAAGYRSGSIPVANVDVLAGVAGRLSDDELEALVADDAELAIAASRLRDDSFRRRVSRKRDQQRNDGGKDAAQQAIDDSRASVAAAKDKTGYNLRGFLDPLRGASVKAAMEREARSLLQRPSYAGMTREQVMAQALHDLVLRGDQVSEKDRTELGVPRASVNISVLVDRSTLEHGAHAETIAETESGLPLSPNQIGQLCCDTTLRRIDTAPDGQVQVSQKVRTATPKQRAALRALYPCCPLSGEGWDHIEIHHVVFYEQSQRTVLSELVPISRRWHHLIHDQGWRLEMSADRTLDLYRPDGTHERTVSPPTPIRQLAELDLAA